MFPYAPGTYREDNDLKIMPHAPARRSSWRIKSCKIMQAEP